MLKDYGIVKAIASDLAEAATEAVNEVIDEFEHQDLNEIIEMAEEVADETSEAVIDDFSDLKGREEEITAQLRGEINRRFLEKVEKKLNAKVFRKGGISKKFSVKVATFKKKQEANVGADLAGIVTYKFGSQTVSKVFLAQAKVGKNSVSKSSAPTVTSYNKDTLNQAEAMLKITSDAFFFIYTKAGIHCVPAFQVVLNGTNSINTSKMPFHSFGSFYAEFLKCFIGDHMISPEKLGAATLEDYAERVSASAVLKLTISLDK